MMKKYLQLVFSICILLVLSACSSSNNNSDSNDDKVLTTLSVTPASVSIILGQTQALTAMATYNDNSTANVTNSVTWSSSDNAVAMVSTNGIVSSVAVGNATITASLSGLNASSDITVKAKVLESLIVEPTTVSIDQGETLDLIATATYDDNSTDNVTDSATWSSNDATVATVDSSVVTGVSSGEAIITASLSGKEATSDITVSNLAHNLRLFISANDGIVGQELFVTDGTADGTSLVKDINTNTNSDPHNMTAVDGVYFFAASDGFTGIELWKSDGTTGGTVKVKDINPGISSSSPSNLTALGNTLYFSANDGTNGTELWMSDGTSAGTVMVKDIYAGQDTDGPNSSTPSSLTVLDNTLYFAANDGTNGAELWKSDGTAIGTHMVKDINIGMSSSSTTELTVLGRTLYFVANDGITGRKLWKSDGTTDGTVVVQADGVNLASPSYLTVMGDTLYFSAGSSTNPMLWKSDGTSAGTVSVIDLDEDGFPLNPQYPYDLTPVGNTLYFGANTFNETELWKSDGTSVGTIMVKDINTVPDVHDPGSSVPRNLTAFGNKLYFSASDGIHGAELWMSDGTVDGTVLVKDINPGSDNGLFPTNPQTSLPFTVLGNSLYFNANDGSNGYELWKSDGTTAGTLLLNDINHGQNNSTPQDLIVFNSVIYFSAYDGTNGRELWRTDGTTDGTFLLEDIGKIGGDSKPGQMVRVGEINYFTTQPGNTENDNSFHPDNSLWRTDSTADGTFLIKDIKIIGEPVTIGDTLYFAADDDINGEELWKSDGTANGTVLVKDINPGQCDSGNPCSSSPNYLTVIGNTLYFRARDQDHGRELWKSDGTTAGTMMVKDIYAGQNFGNPRSSLPNNLSAVGNILYFSANDGTNGAELWMSDGTSAGTLMVKDIYAGQDFGNPRSSVPNNLSAVGNILYFSANDGTNGAELWMSDGTTAGTVMVKDIYAGQGTFDPNSGQPYNLTAVNNMLYFTADDGISGRELWKSDGTNVGTILLKDIDTSFGTDNPNSGSPSYLTAVGDTLYFSANDGNIGSGRELWKSDGTAVGTIMVKDIYVGIDTMGQPNSSTPSGLTAVGNTLYFSANDGINGTELWKSDGTTTSTILVKDINADLGDSSNPVILKNNLFD